MYANSKPGAGAEVGFLKTVREKNFTRIIETLKEKHAWCNTILDVGSSQGIFLKLAARHGFAVTGLEPDKALAEQSRNSGFNVITGFFPNTDALAGKFFDVIIFNDSFEHIPELPILINGIKKHLNKNGVVAVNLPSSGGLMFQIAFLLYRLGVRIPFDRLWQKNFTSPHLHYFNPWNLDLLFKKYGFIQLGSMPLSYYLISGLWRRLRCKSSLSVSAIAWLLLTLLYPFFSVKSDCFVSYFTQNKEVKYA
jgi:SAM-dependent methyltransferase